MLERFWVEAGCCQGSLRVLQRGLEFVSAFVQGRGPGVEGMGLGALGFRVFFYVQWLLFSKSAYLIEGFRV